MSDVKTRSPLAHRKPIEAESSDARLHEAAFRGHVALRLDPGMFGAMAGGALGVDLPLEPNTATGSADLRVLWLGPDEWLITTAPGTQAAVMEKLAAALAGRHHQCVDVSDYYTTIVLAGRRAREMLMKVSTIDFHPRHFSIGQVAAGLYAHANATLVMTREDDARGGPEFEIIVRRSMADYLWCVLAEAGHEFGLPMEKPIGMVRTHLPHFERH